jgi:transcription antitermination factor NusG
MVPGVINYIYWLGKPAVVKDNEIEDIRRFLNEHTDVKVESIELRPDDRVIIRTGLLMDREATVQRIMHKTVEVLIESLGYKLVAQVDKDKIVPVAKNQT